MLFVILTESEAEKLRASTAEREHRLDPRLIELGDQAGSYVLPEEVLYDESHAEFGLKEYPLEKLDPADLWPPVKGE